MFTIACGDVEIDRSVQMTYGARVRDAAFSKWRADALLVGSDPLYNTARTQLVTLAVRHAFPAIYFQRDFVEAGGLISYGPDYADSYRQAGLYVGRISKGAKPAELSVQQSTKLELVINLRVAKALGLDVPPHLLARADETMLMNER